MSLLYKMAFRELYVIGKGQTQYPCKWFPQIVDFSLTQQRCYFSSTTKKRCERILQNEKKASLRHYSIVKPGNVSPLRYVPEHIKKPPYLKPRYFLKRMVFGKLKEIDIKNAEQIEGMKKACALARQILQQTENYTKPGVTTEKIDQVVHDMCIGNNAYPSTLMYKSFPKSLCTSVNNVACHGIPDDRPLQNGDIINIDITVYLDGFHGDTSATYLIGDVDAEGQALVAVARECCDAGISVCKDGVAFARIGEVISETASYLGYTVIPDFCGHGIGEYFHGPPDILHCKNKQKGIMKKGMTFTIEPIITEGDPSVTILSDAWTCVSLDDSRSAQFEHTILVTENGVEILTQ